tara:strand:+ start:530 stop:844 length:315 start_codon:yes stop_codon:yes gene_type:complete
MRRNAKVDGNHKEIVDGLRKFGASVLSVAVLKNCFDILVGYNGENYIMEIKNGMLSPSQKRLSIGENKFKNNWIGGKYHVVESLEQAIDIITKKGIRDSQQFSN